MRVRVGDIRLFFDVDGVKITHDGSCWRERPTVLLLHGGPGGDHSTLKSLFSSLTQNAQVIYLDHRANGRSDDGDPAHWKLDIWADDVYRFCTELEIDAPVVYGSSFGSFVALNYAARYPTHPSKLILASSAARLVASRAVKMFERLGGEAPRDAAAQVFTNPSRASISNFRRVCGPYYASRSPTAHLDPDHVADVSLRFFGGELLSLDLRLAATKVRCPVLVIAGELDPVTTAEGARELAASLPSSLVDYMEFPGAGHSLEIDEPDELVAAVHSFIERS